MCRSWATQPLYSSCTDTLTVVLVSSFVPEAAAQDWMGCAATPLLGAAIAPSVLVHGLSEVRPTPSGNPLHGSLVIGSAAAAFGAVVGEVLSGTMALGA
jgi:hypothetical protein